jgi:hypothetical protein
MKITELGTTGLIEWVKGGLNPKARSFRRMRATKILKARYPEVQNLETKFGIACNRAIRHRERFAVNAKKNFHLEL